MSKTPKIVIDNDRDWYWIDSSFVYWVDGHSPIRKGRNPWNKQLAKANCRKDIEERIEAHRGKNVKWIGFRKKYKALDGDAWNYILMAKYQIHISLIQSWGGTRDYKDQIQRVENGR